MVDLLVRRALAGVMAVLLALAAVSLTALPAYAAPAPQVAYSCHVQNIGWQGYATDGSLGGTSGRALRVEAFKVKLQNVSAGSIEVRSHVQNIGWQDWVGADKVSGTSGRALRVEALQIRLTGAISERYDVYYRTHVQNIGWTGWAKNGESSGSAGYAYRMEGVQIKLVPKGAGAPGPTAKAFVDKNAVPAGALVAYQCHVQNVGWQNWGYDGALGGTSGRALRVEAFKVKLVNQKYTGGIRVRSHVQNIGWQGWAANGQLSGTSGRALRVEALQVELTGDMRNHYDVYYRTHVQNKGWTGWAKNGAPSGSEGYAYRMEAVQIRLVPKGSAAPGSTANPFFKKEPVSSIVYVASQSGEKYHSTRDCVSLKRSKNIVEMTRNQAIARNLEPCKLCIK